MTQTEIQLTLNNLVAKLRTCNKKVRWGISYTKQGDPTMREFDSSYEDGALAAASVEEKMNLLLKDSQIDYIRVDMGNSRVKTKDYVEFIIREQQLNGVMPYRNGEVEIYNSDTRDVRNAKAAYNQMHGNAPFGNVNAMLGLLGFDTGCLNGVDDNSPLGGLGAILAVRDGNIRQQYEMKEQSRLLDVAHQDAATLREEISSLKGEIATKDKTIEKLSKKLERSEERVEELEKMKPENSFGGIALKALGQSILTGVVKSNTGVISALSGIPKPTLDAVMAAQDDGMNQYSAEADDDEAEVEVESEDPRSPQLQQISSWTKNLSDEEFNQYLAIMNVFMLNRQSMTALYNQWKMATVQTQHAQAQPRGAVMHDDNGIKLK
ncbi:MAG: hypothetical protein MJZ31_11485 [Bacteroidales bacterium]|nr:hypothetical protein [Bacteroidales bacterium]